MLTQLWSGESVTYHGEYYQLTDVTFRPRPLQRPRIPIWVGGGWQNQKPMRRAAKYDGVFPLDAGGQMLPEELKQTLAFIESQRGTLDEFDVVAAGLTPAGDNSAASDIVAPYAEAGATWWLETIDPWTETRDWSLPFTDDTVTMMSERIAAGPPRL